MKRKPPDSPAAKAKQAAQRAALNALKRARRTAVRAGIELSDWEGEFLGSVEERIKTYGRAFADPDKGAMGAPLSMMQGQKLREISAKAAGKGLKPQGRKGFGRASAKAKPNRGEPDDV